MAQAVIFCTAGYDHTIRFWEAPSGICYRTLQHPDSQVNKVELTPDKKYLAAAGNPNIRMFEVHSNNPNPVTSFDGHTTNVTALGFQKDGAWMFTGSEDKTVKIWDMRTDTESSRTPSSQRNFDCAASVNSVALHPNQGELWIGDQDGNVTVWDLTADKTLHQTVPERRVAVRSLAVAADSSCAVATNNSGVCYRWALKDSQGSTVDDFNSPTKMQAHKAYILKALFSPDVKYLATTSSDHTVKIWNTKDWTLDKTLTGHSRWVWDAAFSADSAYIVTASSDQSARLWEIWTGDTIRQYNAHNKAVSCLALNDSAA